MSDTTLLLLGLGGLLWWQSQKKPAPAKGERQPDAGGEPDDPDQDLDAPALLDELPQDMVDGLNGPHLQPLDQDLVDGLNGPHGAAFEDRDFTGGGGGRSGGAGAGGVY